MNRRLYISQQYPDMNYIAPDLGYRQYSGQEERQEHEEGHHYTNNYYGEAVLVADYD